MKALHVIKWGTIPCEAGRSAIRRQGEANMKQRRESLDGLHSQPCMHEENVVADGQSTTFTRVTCGVRATLNPKVNGAALFWQMHAALTVAAKLF